MIAFIDEKKNEFGLESIWKELPIAPETYHAAENWQPWKPAMTDEKRGS